MIRYQTNTKGITEKHLHGFFVGWRKKPAPKTHLQLLEKSDYVVIALDSKTGNVVGFVTAISDRVLAAYIPLLEVLPEYREKGIGTQLVKKMLVQLKKFYMVDLVCDTGLQPFYRKLGMEKATGMILRNYRRQSGR